MIDEPKQVNALIYTMGDEADNIITSFGLSEQEMKSFKTVRNKFEDHFVAKRNVIFERAKFYVRVQDENEPVEDFVTESVALSCQILRVWRAQRPAHARPYRCGT